VPFSSVTVNVFDPVAATLVLTFTPGPVRWKSWIEDLSATTSLIVPAFVGFFASVIVKPGPTVSVEVGVAATAVTAGASGCQGGEGGGLRAGHPSRSDPTVETRDTAVPPRWISAR
jgi:hypothetical protein